VRVFGQRTDALWYDVHVSDLRRRRTLCCWLVAAALRVVDEPQSNANIKRTYSGLWTYHSKHFSLPAGNYG